MEHAATSYAPPYIEQDIGLRAHLKRVMPVFLTLRDQDGKGLATAMLPPPRQDARTLRPVIVGDPYLQHGDASRVIGDHFGRVLDGIWCYPYRRA